jgi:hypothetical protein
LLKAVEAVSQAAEAGGGAQSLFKGIDNIIRAKAKADVDQSDQSLTVESVASEVLLRRKAAMAESRLATRVDALWGEGTWTSILEARQAKLDARDQAIERRATQRRERQELIARTLKEIGAVLIILMCLGGAAWILYRLKCTAGAC